MTLCANPYVGPRSFAIGEELYGRDRELQELVDLLIAERIVLLYSPSGAGKTSLVQAGLIRAFQAEGFELVPVMRVGLATTPGNRYSQSCVSGLDEAVPAQHRLIAELSGQRAQKNGDERANELLIFDQFEEILTVAPLDRAAKDEFFNRLGSVLRDRNRWALFVMREDYVAALHPYLRPIPTRLANTYRLDLLGVEAALIAIQRPAAHAGIPFAIEAARKVVDDLRRVRVQLADASTAEQLGDSIEPVVLQVVCRRIWDGLNDQTREIGAAEIAACGDVDRALGGYYADSVAHVAGETGVSERSIRDWFEHRLISGQGIRGQVLQGPDQSEGLDNRAVRRLIETHLVRPITSPRATWFELAHDRLVDPIRKDNAVWRDLHLKPVQKQAAVWDSSGRPAGLLLPDEELAEARRWTAGGGQMSAVEQAFLEASVQAHNIRRRELFVRRLGIGLGALLVIAAASAAYAAYEHVSNTSRELAAQSEAKVQSDPLAALELARQAFAARATPEARQALQLAVQLLEGPRFRGHLEVVNGISFSPDGTLLASASDDKSAKLWTVATGEEVPGWAPVLESKATRAVFSPDGRRVAVAANDGSVQIVDVQSSAKVLVLAKAMDAVNDIAFGPEGKLLASACQDGTVTIWGKPGALRYGSAFTAVAYSPDGQMLVAGSSDGTVMSESWSVPAHVGKINAIAFAPDSKLFATAGDDGAILLWDAATGKQLAPRLVHSFRGVSGISFSQDGTTLASAGLLDGTIKLWDMKSRKEIVQLLAVKQERLRAVAFVPPGHDRLAVAADNSIRLYDLDFERLAHTVK